MTFTWFSKKYFTALMLFVFLTWICRTISFFSKPSTLLSPLYIVHSIQRSRGKKEFAFPFNDWENIYFDNALILLEDIYIQNTDNRFCIVIYHHPWHHQSYWGQKIIPIFSSKTVGIHQYNFNHIQDTQNVCYHITIALLRLLSYHGLQVYEA